MGEVDEDMELNLRSIVPNRVSTLGSIFMMNSIGMVLLTIPSGILADRYGKGKIMVSGFVVTGLAFLLSLLGRRCSVWPGSYWSWTLLPLCHFLLLLTEKREGKRGRTKTSRVE